MTAAAGITAATSQSHVDEATPIGHVALVDQVISTHRTSRGTSTYLRCSCGGFVVLGVDARGETRRMGHAAGRVTAARSSDRR